MEGKGVFTACLSDVHRSRRNVLFILSLSVFFYLHTFVLHQTEFFGDCSGAYDDECQDLQAVMPSIRSSSLMEMLDDDLNDANDLEEVPSSRHFTSFKDVCSSP